MSNCWFAIMGTTEAVSDAKAAPTKAVKFVALTPSAPLLGQVGAGTDAIVDAIARKRNLRLLPSTAAANRLGLSTQVPARLIYHTDGAAARVVLGNLQIDFRRSADRVLALAGRVSGLVAQALRDVGKGKVTADHLRRVRDQLPASARKQLAQDINLVPAWMRPHFKEITRDDA